MRMPCLLCLRPSGKHLSAEAWEATLRHRRRSPAAMMAVARYIVEDTEMCSEGPAMLVCYDAQAAALVRGGAEAMQHVWRVPRRVSS